VPELTAFQTALNKANVEYANLKDAMQRLLRRE
jgi:hypothetical protein